MENGRIVLPVAAKPFLHIRILSGLGKANIIRQAVNRPLTKEPTRRTVYREIFRLKLDIYIHKNKHIGVRVTREDIVAAVNSACEVREKRKDVVRLRRHQESFVEAIYMALCNGTWHRHLHYRPLVKRNNNGKLRNILSPDLTTLVLQHLANHLITPAYYALDPNFGLNCKPGHGITANDRRNSVVKRIKHIYYDRRDLNYAVIIDQRQCYAHIRPQMLRKALKLLTADRWLIDFIISVTFCGKDFPIGTPSSPIMHHIILLSFDLWVRQTCPIAVRYADDIFLPFATREEAKQMMWRVKQFWWYTYRMRAKSFTQRVVFFDHYTDFCGYVFKRNKGKLITDHDKGHVRLRRSIYTSAINCKTNESYASYFGLMKHADMFNVMLRIESTNMDLKSLTSKIRIDRKLDAPPADMRYLCDNQIKFTIYDYELRRDASGNPNWIKCLIGYPEIDSATGEPTGRTIARQYHGNLQFLVPFHAACEAAFPKEELLPMTDVVLEQNCGYIYQGSTNMLRYIN